MASNAAAFSGLPQSERADVCAVTRGTQRERVRDPAGFLKKLGRSLAQFAPSKADFVH